MKTVNIKSWLMPFVLTLGLAIFFYPVQTKYSQSFKFVDEAEHMVMAWLMDHGYKLYRDFPNNHQPIPYLSSYTVQQLSPIDNVFMLLRRHRQFIFIWSLLWWFILLKRFGLKMVIPIGFYESIKYLALGNEFLAEPIAAYPLTYLLTDLMYVPTRKTISKAENFITGFLTGMVQLTVLPLALTLGGMTALRYWQTRGRGLKYFCLGLASLLVMVFVMVNPFYYVREIANALTYSVSGLNPIKQPLDFAKLIGLPLLYLPYYKDILGQTVLIFSSWWLMGLLVLAYTKKRKHLWFGMAVMGLWLITNTRVAHANEYFYQAFHLIPWLLVGMTGGLVLLAQNFKNLPKWGKRAIVIVVSLELAILFVNKNLPIYAKIDPMTENYIQFTPLVEAAEKINALKQPGDRLMVIPNESFLYWMTKLMPAPTNMITYYDWQLEVPKNYYLFNKTLAETPPTFIVYQDDGSSYGPQMNEFLKYNYTQLMQYPNVYIHKSYKDRLR